MIERKAYTLLQEWKSRNGTTALLIEGARRVGKSTLAEEFAKKEYRSYLLLDFATVPDDVKELFYIYSDNLEALFRYLSTYYGMILYPRESLIIFDEIQLFPQARGLIKYLVADGRYDYIETGSLVSIKKNTENILIPSEEEPLRLNPLDFEEFLAAKGEDGLSLVLQQSAASLDPVPQAIHRKAMSLFREYILVGGMPQVVDTFVKTGSFAEADRIKRLILNLYRNDISRYAKGYESKVVAVFDDISSQLSKQEKRFTLASLGRNARSRSYEDAFFWLQDASIVNFCYNSTDPNVGLGLHRERLTFKCYMADTGLLVSHAFSDKRKTLEQVYRSILFDKLEINEGMFMENIVAQSLVASGHSLFFYSRSDREDADERMEIDFLIVDDSTQAKVCPIEVKSKKQYSITSLEKFKKKFSRKIGQQYVLHTKNISIEGDRVFLPLYLVGYL
ncbi:MAG: AAA family ATPase [Coriobacteriia bacterium]|nr:AAA family ATPase [Coriobacteriia bacterium]